MNTASLIVLLILCSLGTGIAILQSLALAASVRHGEVSSQIVLSICFLLQGLGIFYLFGFFSWLEIPYPASINVSIAVLGLTVVLLLFGAAASAVVLRSINWSGMDQGE